MNDKNLDSGPSDRAIAQAFRRIKPLALSNDPPDIVIRAIEKLATIIDATPPAGARDAVTSHEVIAWADKYNIVGEHLVTAYTAAANRDEALTAKPASAGES